MAFICLFSCSLTAQIRIKAPADSIFNQIDPLLDFDRWAPPALLPSRLTFVPQKNELIYFPSDNGIPFSSDQVLIYNGKNLKSYQFYRPSSRQVMQTSAGWVLQQLATE